MHNHLRLFLHRGRILAHVGSARVDAQTFDAARRAVRHIAPAAHQSRRSRHRNEDDDWVHLPTSCSSQNILRLALGRIPRFAT